jgi:predicted GNAT family N-acyltransferase
MKDKLKIYSTKKLDLILINKILKLKSTHWKNSLSSQRNWFKKKLFKDDIHIILKKKKILVGYVVLRKRKFYFNKDNKYFYPILLFDTLIVRKKFRGKKYAKQLIEKTIQISDKLRTLMFLSCKKGLINFYLNLGWKKIDKNNLNILDDKNFKNCILIYKKNLNLKNKFVKKKINIYLNQ